MQPSVVVIRFEQNAGCLQRNKRLVIVMEYDQLLTASKKNQELHLFAFVSFSEVQLPVSTCLHI